MRIVFLNVWHGKLDVGLTDFLEKETSSTDVFCFQEADGLFLKIAKDLLSSFSNTTASKALDDFMVFHQATYIKNSCQVIDNEIVFENDPDIGLGILTTVRSGISTVRILNFHGISKPGDKKDCPNRLKQNQYLLEKTKDTKYPIVIGGDFNIEPDQKSIKSFSEQGYRDLIKEYEVKNTRNRHVWERYPDTIQHFSDYIFVRGNVNIKSFEVPNIEISDHLPMILEVSL